MLAGSRSRPARRLRLPSLARHCLARTEPIVLLSAGVSAREMTLPLPRHSLPVTPSPLLSLRLRENQGSSRQAAKIAKDRPSFRAVAFSAPSARDDLALPGSLITSDCLRPSPRPEFAQGTGRDVSRRETRPRASARANSQAKRRRTRAMSVAPFTGSREVGGGGGIRTRETRGLPVFKTGGFVRSPTPPVCLRDSTRSRGGRNAFARWCLRRGGGHHHTARRAGPG